jgi:CubicO group peptidase (beta-lactamase class C family)
MKELTSNDPGNMNSIFSDLVNTDLIGLSACKVQDGVIIWQGSYGWANLEDKIPVTVNTLFEMCSVSKTITGAALMHLYDKGKFKLDDEIKHYIPFSIKNPNHPAIPITFRMLLSHSSSLADDVETIYSLYSDSEKSAPSLEELVKEYPSLEEIARGFFDANGKYYKKENFSGNKPGEKFLYCNLNYVIIAYLVERLSGRSFIDYCKENLFIPLEMEETGWLLWGIDISHVAYNYINDDNVPSKWRKLYHKGWPGYPDGGLRSSVAEFSNFILMMLNKGMFKGKQILTQSTVEKMLTTQNVDVSSVPQELVPIDGIGLTWHVLDIGSTRYFYHAGGGTGISSIVLLDLANKAASLAICTGSLTPAVVNTVMSQLLQ